MRLTDARSCPHGLYPFSCPACTERMHEEFLAEQLARRDPETWDRWADDFRQWSESPDAVQAERGDSPEAP